MPPTARRQLQEKYCSSKSAFSMRCIVQHTSSSSTRASAFRGSSAATASKEPISDVQFESAKAIAFRSGTNTFLTVVCFGAAGFVAGLRISDYLIAADRFSRAVGSSRCPPGHLSWRDLLILLISIVFLYLFRLCLGRPSIFDSSDSPFCSFSNSPLGTEEGQVR
jgi:hypothetical protein